MKAARCAPALCGGQSDDLAAATVSHRSNFLAAGLYGTENSTKQPGIRRMSDEINPKPRFSYYRPSGEEGEAPLPAGTCCREGADGRHRSRHSGGSIRIPAIPCIDLGVCALPPQSLSRVRPKAAVFVEARALSLNQRVQGSSPCAPTKKSRA